MIPLTMDILEERADRLRNLYHSVGQEWERTRKLNALKTALKLLEDHPTFVPGFNHTKNCWLVPSEKDNNVIYEVYLDLPVGIPKCGCYQSLRVGKEQRPLMRRYVTCKHEQIALLYSMV